MRAAVSIIIPTLNADAGLPGCLSALVEGLKAGLIREVTLSDGGSTDRTLALAEAAGALCVTGAPSRGGQLRRGAEAAQGDWLMFLHADTCLAPGWSTTVQAALARGQAGYGTLAFDTTGAAPRLVAGWANLRSDLFGLPYGDQALLLPRSLYLAVDGFPDQPLMEDVAIARRLKGQLKRLDMLVVTSAEKYQRQGWVRRGARNLWTLIRYMCGADPKDLAKTYRRNF